MKFNISVDVERDLHSGYFKGVEEGLKELDGILSRHNVKATLFVTGEVFVKYKKLFKEYEEKGYEIACHGYSHKRLDEVDLEEEFRFIGKTFDVKGFRAPQHSMTDEALEYLEKYGFSYDSSYTPWNLLQVFFFPNKISLNHLVSKRKPYMKGRILEIPVSSFKWPFGAFTLRIFPLIFSRLLYYFLNKEIVLFYLHSWDLIELKGSKAYSVCGKKCFLRKLDKLVGFLCSKGKPILLKDYKLSQ